jgi:hypothetical protein
MSPSDYNTIKQLAGAIFFSLLSLWDDDAEREAIGHLREALAAGSVSDPYARSILAGLIKTAEDPDISCVPTHVLQNLLKNRGRRGLDGVAGADEILSELMRRKGGGSA